MVIFAASLALLPIGFALVFLLFRQLTEAFMSFGATVGASFDFLISLEC